MRGMAMTNLAFYYFYVDKVQSVAQIEKRIKRDKCDFVLFVGNKRLIKRVPLEKWLAQAYSI